LTTEKEQRAVIKFSLPTQKEIELVTMPGVFTPNATTTLMIQALRNTTNWPAHVLELGCGTGVIGIALQEYGLVHSPLYASDLSESAVLCSRENYARYGCPADVRGGSLFEPWPGEKFDMIIDDISGIAQDVAKVSPWFQGVPCDTGKDGTDLVTEIIRQAPQHLKKDGRFFFPVLSLSNVDRLLRVAKEQFATIEKVGHQDWPLPTELMAHLPLLRQLRSEGSIILEERFGMVLCYTEVYCARTSNAEYFSIGRHRRDRKALAENRAHWGKLARRRDCELGFPGTVKYSGRLGQDLYRKDCPDHRNGGGRFGPQDPPYPQAARAALNGRDIR